MGKKTTQELNFNTINKEIKPYQFLCWLLLYYKWTEKYITVLDLTSVICYKIANTLLTGLFKWVFKIQQKLSKIIILRNIKNLYVKSKNISYRKTYHSSFVKKTSTIIKWFKGQEYPHIPYLSAYPYHSSNSLSHKELQHKGCNTLSFTQLMVLHFVILQLHQKVLKLIQRKFS